MAKHYIQMPSKHQWKLDLGLRRPWGGHFKSPFPAMERIGKLIDEYDRIRNTGDFQQVAIVYQIHRHARSVAKTHAKNSHVRKKLGDRLDRKQLDAVEGLRDYCRRELCNLLAVPDHELNHELMSHFGRRVGNAERDLDEGLIEADVIVWHPDDAERAEFKLAFRKGLAYRWWAEAGVKAGLELYDTDAAGDVVEYGGSLYVMDARGRIYVLGRDLEERQRTVVHSSLLGGEDTLAAGTIRIENGRIVWISAKSGHYKPVVRQMINLLERLRSYQVDLTRVVVYRENLRVAHPGSPDASLEPCDAMTLLTQRRWPDEAHPNVMHVS